MFTIYTIYNIQYFRSITQIKLGMNVQTFMTGFYERKKKRLPDLNRVMMRIYLQSRRFSHNYKDYYSGELKGKLLLRFTLHCTSIYIT